MAHKKNFRFASDDSNALSQFSSKDKATAYLETGHLVQAALEKSEQETSFSTAPFVLSKASSNSKRES